MKRSIVYSFIIVLLLLTIYSSCKKNEPKTGETRLIKGNSAIRNQSWMELRDQARQEFEFYFGTYYHTRDFLGNLDWKHAILYEMDGAKIMVFLFQTRYSDKIDAKLLVKQGDNGQNIYMIRVRSTGSKGKYASIYTANDKVLHLGSIENNAFNEFGRTRMESRTIEGAWPAGCNICHGGSSEDDWEWDDPVPGGGSLWVIMC